MPENVLKFLLYRADADGTDVRRSSLSPEWFTNVRELGTGSTCRTYLAVSGNGNNVVIKELCPQKFRRLFERRSDGSLVFRSGTDAADRGRMDKQKAAFVREFLWQKEIQSRNSFTGGNSPVLYTGGDTLYNVMSYDGDQLTIRGAAALAKEFREHIPAVDYARLILCELRNYAAELAVVHDMGCVVSDIKPGNVLITRSEWGLSYRRMIDYGSVNRLSDINSLPNGQKVDPSLFSYTQQFAAPEVLGRRYSGIGPWSDVYSFGMTVMAFLTGRTIASSSLFLSRSTSKFREIALYNDECGTLSGKDAGFITRLRNFCEYTLSPEVMESDVTPDEAFGLMQRSDVSHAKRVRNMYCVIRMLDALLDDSAAGTDEPEVRARTRSLLRRFSDNSFGMPGERETNAILFSEKLLPMLTRGDKTIPAVSLLESGAGYSLTGGNIRSVYIEGESGAGKTTALQYIACKAAGMDDGPVTVWISLADLFLSPGGGDRLKQLRGVLCRQLFGEAAYDEIAARNDRELDRYLIGEGGCPKLLLIFDGLNEAALCGSGVPDWLEAISRVCASDNVASVFSGHDQAVEFPSWTGTRLRTLPCSVKTAEEYIGDLTRKGRLNWRPEQLGSEIADRTLRLLDSPMLLHYFALRYLDIPIDASQLPRNKALLIEQYLTSLGRNCAMQRVHRIIAGESMQTDIPYGRFLMNTVAGSVCLDMLINRSSSVSADELREAVDAHLAVSVLRDGTTVRSINGRYISREAYKRMISFDSDREGRASWITHFFVSRASGNYTVIHETIGVCLAAGFLADVIRNIDGSAPPDVFLRPDLPEPLVEMTAMLLCHDDVKKFRKAIIRTYGNSFTRAVRGYFRDFTGKDEVLLNNEYRAINIGTVGHNFRSIVNGMDNISGAQRFALLRGIPDNRAERLADSVIRKTFRKGALTDEEKEKLGKAMKKVASQPEVLEVARLLWRKHPEMKFRSDIDVLLKACDEIYETAALFLENRGIPRTAALIMTLTLMGTEELYPGMARENVEEMCALVVSREDLAGYRQTLGVSGEMYQMLHRLPLVESSTRLRTILGARLLLQIIVDTHSYGGYADILEDTLPEKLLYEASNIVFSNLAEVHENFYPEKWHAELMACKPTVYRSYAEKMSGAKKDSSRADSTFFTGSTAFNYVRNGIDWIIHGMRKLCRIDTEPVRTDIINYSDPAVLVLEHFCAVEYAVRSQAGEVGSLETIHMTQGQCNALTQLFVILNYAVCDGHIGRMTSSKLRFEDGSIAKDELSSGGRMCIIIAMMSLGMYNSVSIGEYYRFKWRYIRDYKILTFKHVDRKETMKLLLIGMLILIVFAVFRPPGWLVLSFFLVIALMNAFYFLMSVVFLLIELAGLTVGYYLEKKQWVVLVLVLIFIALMIYFEPMLAKGTSLEGQTTMDHLRKWFHF